jgi:hypothetical protein
MKRTISLLSLAVVLLWAGTASGTTYSTTITHDGSATLTGGSTVDSGHVKSSGRLCSLFRTVKLFAHYPDGSTQLLDIDLTSVRGAWATKADLDGADRVKAKAIRESFRVHHHRKVCKAAAVVWALA